MGIDFTLKALDAALGVQDATSAESFRRVVERSTAQCPRLALTACALESYRRQSSTVGDGAVCNVDCTEEDLVQVQEEKCPGISDYPVDVWINRVNENIEFSEKSCCRVSDTYAEPDSTCLAPDDNGSSTALIVGVTLGIILVVGLIVAAVLYRRWKYQIDEMSVFDTQGSVKGPLAPDVAIPTSIHSGRGNSGRVLIRLASDRTLPPDEQTQPDHAPSPGGPLGATTDGAEAIAVPMEDATMEDMPIATNISQKDGPHVKDQCTHVNYPGQHDPTPDGSQPSSFQNATGGNSEDLGRAEEESPMTDRNSHI